MQNGFSQSGRDDLIFSRLLGERFTFVFCFPAALLAGGCISAAGGAGGIAVRVDPSARRGSFRLLKVFDSSIDI